MMEPVIFSTEYAVPYHGSVWSVCPSKFVDSQKILRKGIIKKAYKFNQQH